MNSRSCDRKEKIGRATKWKESNGPRRVKSCPGNIVKRRLAVQGSNKMRIAGVGSALPENRFQQPMLTEALKQHWGAKLRNPELMERMHSRTGVDYRYLAFPLTE